MKTQTNTEIETLKSSRTDLMQVDPHNITVEEGFNVRQDYGDIEGLAHSVVQLGVIDPVKGYKVRGEDRYVIIEGHRRLKAVLLAHDLHIKRTKGFEDISKIARIFLTTSTGDMEERLYIMGATGEKKKNLNDLERAELYKRLIEHGKEKGKKRSEVIREIVSKLGVSQPTVYNILLLNEIHPDIRDFVASNQISGGAVIAIINAEKDLEKQKELVLEAIYDAEDKSKASGGKVKVKATAANVKGLKPKSPLQMLKEASNNLANSKTVNSKTKLLDELIEAINTKTTLEEMVQLFL